MRRRQFITLLGSGAVVWPLVARAQQPSKLPTIGIMGSGSASSQSDLIAVFLKRLNELGWAEGGTVAILYSYGEGRPEAYAKIASEFVRLKVDVIVTSGTPAVLAAKQATLSIPIVFPTAGDPVATGLVASLAHPGGNVTGLGFQTTDTASKRVELLREVIPNLRELAILANPDDPGSAAEMREAKTVASALNLTVTTIEVRRAGELTHAFEALKGAANGLYVSTSPIFVTNSSLIGTLALRAQLPTIHSHRTYVDAGGLMSYGATFADQWRRAAEIVDKVLRGTKPADIPVEQPTKFEFIINLKTAKALGLNFSHNLVGLADKVIE